MVLSLYLFFHPTGEFKISPISQEVNFPNIVEDILIKKKFFLNPSQWLHFTFPFLKAAVKVYLASCVSPSHWTRPGEWLSVPTVFKCLAFSCFWLRYRYFLILALASLYRVRIIKFSFLIEKYLMAIENLSVLFYLAGAYIDKLLNPRLPTYHPMLLKTGKTERHSNHTHPFL